MRTVRNGNGNENGMEWNGQDGQKSATETVRNEKAYEREQELERYEMVW